VGLGRRSICGGWIQGARGLQPNSSHEGSGVNSPRARPGDHDRPYPCLIAVGPSIHRHAARSFAKTVTRSSLSDVPDQVVSFLYQLSDLISDQHLMWGVAGPGADVFSPFGFSTIPLEPDTDLRDWFLKGLKQPRTTSLKNKRLDLIDHQWAEGFPYELMATARWLVQRLPGSLNQETFAGTPDESPWFVEPRGAPTRLSNPMPMLYREPERPLYISAITGGA
jgi:hypothetical protein